MSSEGFVEVKVVEKPEAFYNCVQCGSKYKESENADGICSFHVSSGNSCSCGQRNYCKSTKHRAVHHCDYPYGAFFERAGAVFGYTDTTEKFLEVKETSMDGGDEQYALVGQLFRWKSRAPRVATDTFFLKVGELWSGYKSKYYFNTWTVDELKAIPPAKAEPYRSLIFRSKDDTKEFAQAEWQFSPSGSLIGVVLTCKARDNAEPTSKLVTFGLDPLKVGEVTVLSEGSFREYGPEGGFAAYAAVCQSVNAGNAPAGGGPGGSRPARKFPVTGNLPAILWITEPLQCSQSKRDAEGKGVDWFETEISLYNTSPDAYLLTNLQVEWRLVGEKKWEPVQTLGVPQRNWAPVAAHPLAATPLKMNFSLASDGPANHWGARGRSLIASKAPIRVRVTITDLDGASVCQVLEFVNAPLKLEGPKSEDALFVYADNATGEERSCVHCTVKEEEGNVQVYVGSYSVDGEALQLLAGQACSQKVSELPVPNLSSSSSYYKQTVTALIDQSCQRVWALKVEMARTDCDHSNFGLVAVPLYGKTTPTRAISIHPPKPHATAKTDESKTKGANDDDFDDVPANHVRKLRPPTPSPLVALLQSIAKQNDAILSQLAAKK